MSVHLRKELRQSFFSMRMREDNNNSYLYESMTWNKQAKALVSPIHVYTLADPEGGGGGPGVGPPLSLGHMHFFKTYNAY